MMNLIKDLLFYLTCYGAIVMNLKSVTAIIQHPGTMQSVTCFSSSLPAAHEIGKVYDDNFSEGVFWSKENSLPSCNIDPINSSSQCFVCTDQSAQPETVLVFCYNLTATMDLLMEGPEGRLQFNKTYCPESPSDDGNKQSFWYIFLPICFFFIIIIIIIMACKRCWSQKTIIFMRCAADEVNMKNGPEPTQLVDIV